VNLAMAGVRNQPPIREVLCAPAFLGYHVVHVESLAIFQMLMTHGTKALLPLDELPATTCGHLRLGASVSPVVL
jgi:hypothetical protein